MNEFISLLIAHPECYDEIRLILLGQAPSLVSNEKLGFLRGAKRQPVPHVCESPTSLFD